MEESGWHALTRLNNPGLPSAQFNLDPLKPAEGCWALFGGEEQQGDK
jgi:hypothetical protein